MSNMTTTTDTNKGWNGTRLRVGDTVKVWGYGFGRGVRACVESIHGDSVEIRITKGSKRCPYAPGNRTTVNAWWLEGSR